MLENLDQTVLTGTPGFTTRFSVPFWEYHDAHPADQTVFNDAMKALGEMAGSGVGNAVRGRLVSNWLTPN